MNRKANPSSLRYALAQKFYVMHAVALRDMRTRFFNHGLGFLVVSIWPLTHIFMLLLIYTLAGRQPPFGESLNVFFATGLIPTLSFMYISRFMSLSLIINKPMLSFPAVKVFDVMMARAFLEVIAGTITLLFTFIILLCLGDDPFPYDPPQAVLAYLSTLLLAVGVGSLASVLVMFADFFATIYALLMIVVYISSGTLFVVSFLPDAISTPLSWSPITQCVEWMRTAYYPSYSDKIVDKTYVVSFGLTALGCGLLLERVFRRKMLES